MRKLCFLILFIFITYDEATKQKSVNLALETVLEFDKKDIAADVKFLDDVQNFIYKVKSAINNNRTSRRFDSNTKNIKFTDFVKNVIDILKTYDDDDLEDTFAVFDDEIRKYHYRGCKFYELVADHDVRRFVANKLNVVKDKPASHIRKYLDKVAQAIEDAKFSGSQTLLLDYINSLYAHDSNEKLKAFIYNLQAYRRKSKRANLNLIKVMQDGIRSVIFDHYSNLNANARRDLRIRLETNWKDHRWPEGVDHKVFTVEFKYNPLKKENKLKFIDLDEHTRELGAKTHSIERAASITEKIKTNKHTTSHYKKKHGKRNREVREKEDTTKKHRYNKISSFITLYPEEIEINTNKRYKIQESTRDIRMVTLWEEKIESEKRKRKDNRFKIKKNVDQNIPRHFISKYDTVINVKRTMSNEKDTYYKHQPRYLKTDRVETKWKNREYRIKTPKDKPTTMKKFRKHLSITPPLASDEGMSIEGNEVKRRSMMMTTHKAGNDTSVNVELKRNVLRRINNLEKQMEEVKFKIDTKHTTKEIERLKFWEGTTKTSIKSTTTTTASPTTTKSTSKLTTKEETSSSTTKPNSPKQTTTETTSTDSTVAITTESKAKSNITVNTSKPYEEITTSAKDFDNILANMSTPEEEPILASPLENLPGSDLIDVDEDIDKIMKKYNVTQKLSNTSNDIESLLRNMKPEDKKMIDLNEGNEKKDPDDEVKEKPVDDAEFADPLQDINAALALL